MVNMLSITFRCKMNRDQAESVVRVIANGAFGFNGSDPDNPPMKGLDSAVDTFLETLKHEKIEMQKEMVKVVKEWQKERDFWMNMRMEKWLERMNNENS